MSNSNQQVVIPQIRFFQFEAEKLGVFDKSVNLFRGDINFNRTLFSMPGRPGTKHMDVQVAVQYQSNLQQQVTTHNLSAPTGILGMGWDMPLNKISLQSDASFSKANRKYMIQSDGIAGPLVLTHIQNGKEYYQCKDYQFWIICYDPLEESWEIIHETGITHVYGGGVGKTIQGNNTSQGNSIAWGVRYGNWIGSTRLTGSVSPGLQPEQFAREWYLSGIRNTWKDNISYGYNEFPRDNNGLIEGVEQFVGDEKGKPYTRAVYLTSITDIFNRTAVFTYHEKTFDNSTADAPKEYQSPHSNRPDLFLPNGFQDTYETKYLDSISVNTVSGDLINKIGFDYLPLQNLTDFTDTLKGFTYKRFLAAITSYTTSNDSLPALEFTYNLDKSLPDSNIGALQTIMLPEGALAKYTYEKKSLPVCQRSVQISKPDKSIMGSNSSIPRVWFGSDFTIVTWYNLDSGRLWLGIYSWQGYWKLWNPDDPIIYADANGITTDSLNTVISGNSAGIYFNNNENTFLFTYSKDPRQAGEWVAYKNGSETSLTFPSPVVTFSSGDHFILANENDVSQGTQSLTRIAWDWKMQNWLTEKNINPVNTNSQLMLSKAGSEYYITFILSPDDNSAELQLTYLFVDASNKLSWINGDSLKIPNINASDIHSFNLQPGSSIATLMAVTGNGRTSTQYDLHILSWNETYQFGPLFSTSFNTQKNNQHEAAFDITPRIISNCLIVSGENFMRYNGQSWLINSSLQVNAPSSANEYWFAYGDDYILQTVNGGAAGISSLLLPYDANSENDITAWTSVAFGPKPSPVPPPHNQQDAYYPTAGGEDYFTSGQNIYYRGSSTDWNTPAAQPAFIIQDAINSKSLVNQAPDFFAYVVPDGNQPGKTKTVVLELKNGIVQGTGTTLQGQLYNLDISKPGTRTFGPGSIMTFAADTLNQSLDNAAELTLYRYAGNAIQGNIIHYPVSLLQVADGFGVDYSTAYDFDASSAACDPGGTIVKYYKSCVYPGTANPSSATFGSTVNHYINGFNNQEPVPYFLNGKAFTGNAPYPGLDGMKKSVEHFDSKGNSVKRQDFVWDIFTKRNSDPVKKDTVPLQLYGSYIKQHSLTQVLDGVTEVTTQQYIPANFDVPFSGMTITESKTNFNGLGVQELLTSTTRYGYEQYPQLAILNQLNIVVQKTQSVTPVGGSLMPIGVKVTTMKEWQPGMWMKCQTMEWKGVADPAFPFPSDYSTPQGWLCTNEVTAMNENGMILEMNNSIAQPNSVMYSQNGEYVIAQFKYASVANGEADYYGFEKIESGSGWLLNTKAQVVTGNAYTGLQSLCLQQGGSLSKSFQPFSKNIYIIGYWYKTAAGYEPSNGSGWSITVSVPGSQPAVNSPIQKSFADTGGKWIFDYVLVDLSAFQPHDKVTVAVQASNNSSNRVWIDNVRWVQQLHTFSAYAYDTVNSRITSQLGNGSLLERVYYDQFSRRIGTVGPEEDQLNTFYLNYFSRQQNNNLFNPLDPNCEVQIKALDGGSTETFRDSLSWQQNWNASGAGANWETSNGRLIHTNAGSSDTLTSTKQDLSSGYAFYFGVEGADGSASNGITDVLGISLGVNNSISWNPTTKQWQFLINGNNETTLFESNQMSRYWTLIVKPEVLLFFADGRLLLSQVLTNPITSVPSFFTGKNKLALNFLALANKPMTGLVYKDALENIRQNHALNGANAIINQVICDPLGKKIIKTKSAPAIFGSTGINVPLMIYRPGFVDVQEFLNNLYGSCIMNGDLSTYYNGQNDASNDEGYPYYRKLLDNTPLSRIIEKGLPGKEHAVIDPSTSDPMQRKTCKFFYSNNKDTVIPGLSDLPQGEYYVLTQMQANGKPNYELRDKSSAMLVKGMPDHQQNESGNKKTTTQDSTSLLNRRHLVYDMTGRTVIQRSPAYYNTTLPGNPAFQTIKKYDPLNYVVQTQAPDSGITQMINNSAGLVRFQQDAEGAAKGYFSYLKYNKTNHLIEKGIIQQQWDAATLQAQADQPGFPGTMSGLFIQKKITYSNYEQGQNGLGKIFSVTTFSEDGSGISITENFVYDNYNRAQQITVVIETNGQASDQYTVEYEYLASGLMKKVGYPAAPGSGINSVYYFYDDLGRMISVGRSESETDYYASYSYTPENNVLSKKLNQNTLINNSGYHSPGWLASLQPPGPSQGFYEVLPAYSDDGQVKSISDIFDSPGVKSSLSIEASLNEADMLSSVNCVPESNWSLSDMQYDANGNLLSLTANNSNEQYVYKPGTNQVQQLLINNEAALTFTYNAKGGVSSTLSAAPFTPGNLSFTYIKDGFLTAGVKNEITGDQSAFYYGSQHRRFLKRITNSTGIKSEMIGIHGKHNLPLMEISGGAAVIYIYGPDGLIAFEKKNQLCFVVKDHLGSNRLVVDINNKVKAAYSYSSFGQKQVIYESEPGLLNYLYTGQEWMEELGLYNFRARLYDYRLRRFYHTDPKGQFVGVYVFNGENPLAFIDPSGMFSIGEFFQGLLELIVSLAEIVVGVVLDIYGGEAVAGAFIGAGLSTITGYIVACANSQTMSWASFGEAQGVGAVSGLVSGGMGFIGDLVSEGATSAMTTASDAVKTGVGIAIRVGFGTVGGAGSGLLGKLTANGMNHSNLDEGMLSTGLISALTGAVGTGLGEAGGPLTTKLTANVSKSTNLAIRLAVGITAGAITGTVGGVITWATDQEHFSWVDFAINLSTGSLESISGTIKGYRQQVAQRDPREVIAAFSARQRLQNDNTQPLLPYGSSSDIEMTPMGNNALTQDFN